MAGYIQAEIVSASTLATESSGCSEAPILRGEIDGVTTNVIAVTSGKHLYLPALHSAHRIIFIVSGNGSINDDSGGLFYFKGLSVYVPKYQTGCSINSIAPSSPLLRATAAPTTSTPARTDSDCSGTSVTALEVQFRMADQDAADLANPSDKLPYFLAYADAKTYKEAFKSPKTTSRTLVPTNIVPRFAAGSVQTTGPDAVGAHSHPMLEQLFLGLPGSNQTVVADSHKKQMTEWMLLHIPLGSMHGVDVDDVSQLHYIWMDFFREKKGQSWIDENHKEE